MSDSTKTDRLRELLRERSVRTGKFKLASGRESDFFIDCKQTVLTAEGHALVGELMYDALSELPECDAVAGVELGGCSLASAVSLISHQKGRDLNALYIRKARKGHGTTRTHTTHWRSKGGLHSPVALVVACQYQPRLKDITV